MFVCLGEGGILIYGVLASSPGTPPTGMRLMVVILHDAIESPIIEIAVSKVCVFTLFVTVYITPAVVALMDFTTCVVPI